jgi:small subunit ribosomal protein S6
LLNREGEDGLRSYELVYIVRPDLDEEGLKGLTEKVAQFVASNGGKVAETNVWGKRRLAYPIHKLQEGCYVLTRIELEPQAMNELERNLKLSEEIIRYLMVRL